MKAISSQYGRYFRSVLLLAPVLLLLCWSRPAHAQFLSKWLSAGSLHHHYSEGGTEAYVPGRGSEGLQWPAIRPYANHDRTKLYNIAALNWTDETGREWPVKVVHQGHIEDALDQVFPLQLDLVSRFEAPEVTVDGFESFDKAVFIDEINPDMEADRKIVNTVNTQLGLTLRREVLQFSNEYHDNYHISEITLINTGNVDEDPEIELEGQTLEGVYFWEYHRHAFDEAAAVESGPTNWGRWIMNDAIGFGMEDFEPEIQQEFGPEYRGYFSWHGFNPGFTQWDNIGAPAIEPRRQLLAPEDTVGRLTASEFFGRLVLHADKSVEDRTDDLEQPRTLAHIDGNDPLLADMDAYNVSKMQLEYNTITAGRVEPHHADIIAPPQPGVSWAERMAYQTNDPSQGNSSGYQYTLGYGPYTIPFGDSIHIVVVEAVAGLSQEANLEIGKAYKRLWGRGNGNDPISFDADGDGQIEADEKMSKNLWVMTSRDSLLKTFKRARANYLSGYEVPHAPLPPQEFNVSSGTDEILLQWALYPGANPQGFEIYRTVAQRDNLYDKIATLPGNTKEYRDTDIQRGLGYYYYIQAVGEVNEDPTGLTPTGIPLKSNRYYTQTYDPASLKRAPGASLEAVRIVPNPYHLGSDPNVRWPDVQDRIAFLEIPGRSTIKIFSELGELVETIEHTDGSGDEFWDLTTSSDQVVVSGVYMAVIEDQETGARVIRSFSIIR